MNNIVLFEPEIPQNTGNIMRTCVATDTTLHLIKPLGFVLDDAHLKRSGVNYIDKLRYHVYENFDDFVSKNKENITSSQDMVICHILVLIIAIKVMKNYILYLEKNLLAFLKKYLKIIYIDA